MHVYITRVCAPDWGALLKDTHVLERNRNRKSLDYGVCDLRSASRSVKVRSIKIDGPVREGIDRRFLIISG